MKYIHIDKFNIFLQYYKKFVIGSFLIGVVLNIVIRFILKADIWYIELILWAFYALLFLLLFLVDYHQSIKSFKGLVINKMIAKWHILDKDGNISSDFSYFFQNNSTGPIGEISVDREGFSKEVKYKPFFFASNNKQIKRSSIAKIHKIVPNHDDNTSTRKVYTYQVHLEINPKIDINEEFEIIRQYDVKGSEKDAFSSNGTYASIRIAYPTKEVVLLLFSPPHYKIKILSYFIGNEEGIVIDKESRKQICPKVSDEEDYIYWRIIYPVFGFRYAIKYRLLKRNEF